MNWTVKASATRKKCRRCGLIYVIPLSNGAFAHKCPACKCKLCWVKLEGEEERSDPSAHRCYIQPVALETEHSQKLIFYDFETYADENNVPFLVCTKTFQGREWPAYGLDCVTVFLRQFRRPRFAGSVFIAKNARGFDSYLLLWGMIKTGLTPTIIMQGCKILCIQDPDFRLKYIDSLSFLSMRLSAMPKALGFEDRSKGYFPHRFSSKETLHYAGSYPPPSEYGADVMTSAERGRFDAWYNEVSGGVFDFKEQLCTIAKTT